MERVVELALQVPGKLRLVEVAGMDGKAVGVDWDGRVLEIDQDLDHAAGFLGRKSKQRMIVEAEVLANLPQLLGIGHQAIL